MTKNGDLDVPGLAACTEHTRAIPVVDGGRILYWLCGTCGAMIPGVPVSTGDDKALLIVDTGTAAIEQNPDDYTPGTCEKCGGHVIRDWHGVMRCFECHAAARK